jgi:L-threonylcarbamoyladenylate synthase
VTKDDFCCAVIKKLGKPVVSTSANLSGQPSPGNFQEISREIKKSVDHIVNLKQNEGKKSKPSSVIKIEMNNEVKIIRE